jgi:hypothetical protein
LNESNKNQKEIEYLSNKSHDDDKEEMNNLNENMVEIEELQDYFNNSSDETNQLILHNNNEDIVDFLG